MDMFKNITNFNESVEQPDVGQPGDLIFGGGCCLAAGAFALLANVVGLTAIWSNKKLHTPCFSLISAQLICACLTAFGFFTDGAQFVASGAHILDAPRIRLICFVFGVPKTVSMAPSALLTCMVGVDRFVSIAMPVHYRRFGYRYAITGIILCAVVSAVNTAAAAITGPPMYAIIPCYNSFLAYDIYFFIYYTCHNLFFCCISVVVYAAIFALLKIRRGTKPALAAVFASAKNVVAPHQINSAGNSHHDDMFMRQQLALVPMIAAMMILYIVTGVIPEVATSAAAFLDEGRYQPRVVVYASVLKACGCSADIFVLCVKCREFRNSISRMAYRMCRKENIVIRIPSVDENA